MSRQVFDTMKKRKYACPNDHDILTEIRWGRDPLPFCSTCQSEMYETFGEVNQSSMISTDDIPGGLEIRHAICNPDGTPRKYYSKSEIRKAAAEAGYTIHGETPKPLSRIVEDRHRESEAKGRNWY